MKKIIFFIFIFYNSVCLATEQSQHVEDFVNSMAHRTVAIIKYDEGFIQKKEQIKNLIDKTFDVSWMGKFVLGRYFNDLTVEQRKQYNDLYLLYLVNNYFPILMKYDGQKFKITNVVKSSDDSFDVSMVILQDKKPISLKYHIRQINAGAFKALDMVVEGISTIISQRSEFKSIIQQDGIDSLLLQMRSKYQKSGD